MLKPQRRCAAGALCCYKRDVVEFTVLPPTNHRSLYVYLGLYAFEGAHEIRQRVFRPATSLCARGRCAGSDTVGASTSRLYKLVRALRAGQSVRSGPPDVAPIYTRIKPNHARERLDI